MEKITKRQKITLFILALIVSIPVTIGVISTRMDNECLKRIETDGIITLGYMRESYKRANSGIIAATIVYSDGKNEYYEESPSLLDRFPANMPVYVKYSASDPECVIVLMDSAVIINNQKIQYYHKKFFGWGYKIEKIGN
jgi:hypothetical protein